MSSPVLYIPHGGGPLPLLGDPAHEVLVRFLKAVPGRLGRPSAILVVSAHWEADVPAVTAGAHPPLIYDYFGFPEQAYHIRYPAPGDPALAARVQTLLASAGLHERSEAERGFDHGLFIPLKIMYPEARIPCLQLSLLAGLDPGAHIALGRAIAALRDENVLVLGSGLSFHNMRALMDPGLKDDGATDAFHDWLIETCASTELDAAQRERRLLGWPDAPGARFCHPREEHLLPLHVCFGCAGVATPGAQVVFDGSVMGRRAAAFLW